MRLKKTNLKTLQIKKPIIRHVVKTTKSKTIIFKKKLFNTWILTDIFHGPQEKENILFLEPILLKMD